MREAPERPRGPEREGFPLVVFPRARLVGEQRHRRDDHRESRGHRSHGADDLPLDLERLHDRALVRRMDLRAHGERHPVDPAEVRMEPVELREM